MPNQPSENFIKSDDSVRDILTRFPHAEAVFNNHGMGGCGGPKGPTEPVAFFAQVHDTEPTKFLAELNEFISKSETDNTSATRDIPKADRPLYPIFLKTSLVVALTLGFSMGLWAILGAASGISMGPFSWNLMIQTHGVLQIWGFVGLFIMGVSYQILPRFKGKRMADKQKFLARLSYWAVTTGILLQVFRLLLPDPSAYSVVFASDLLLAIGALSFSAIIFSIYKFGNKTEIYGGYLVSGVSWFVVGGLFQTAALAWMWRSGNILLPFNLDEPLILVMIIGFVVLLTMGVSVRAIPAFLDLKPSRPLSLRLALCTLNLAVLVSASGLILSGTRYRQAGTWLWSSGSILVALGVLSFLFGLRIFEASQPKPLKTLPKWVPKGYKGFIKISFLWLLLGVVLVAWLSTKSALLNQGPSFTQLSAARHAVAFGFVTTIIVAMASRILPVFEGKRLFSSNMQVAVFWLILLSAILRVGVEFVEGYGTSLNPFLSASGALAFIAIFLFAVNMWMTMSGKSMEDVPNLLRIWARPGLSLGPQTPLKEIARKKPEALDILANLGLFMLRDSKHREAAVDTLTLDQVAKWAKLDVCSLISSLKESLDRNAANITQSGIRADMLIADVLDRHPQTLPVFLKHGFTPLANADMRKKLASTITIAQAAQMREVDLMLLLNELKAEAQTQRSIKQLADA